MQILVSGAETLVDDFCCRNPDYFNMLSRVNGSAVKSLFSQLKYSVAGKLLSVNYSTARASVLFESSCQTSNASNN